MKIFISRASLFVFLDLGKIIGKVNIFIKMYRPINKIINGIYIFTYIIYLYTTVYYRLLRYYYVVMCLRKCKNSLNFLGLRRAASICNLLDAP